MKIICLIFVNGLLSGLIGSRIMKNKRLYRFAVDLFIEMLTKIQGKRMKPYRCNDNDTRSWIIFCDYFTEQKIAVTEELVRKFIEYGMHSWFNEDTEYTVRQNVRFSWIFGNNAIKRWNALPTTARNHYSKIIKKDYKIKRGGKSSPRLSELLNRVRPIEEKFKQEFLNTPRGLLWCIANTTLFLHKSPSCTICNYKDECKSNLKTNMPSVYKKRGYK